MDRFDPCENPGDERECGASENDQVEIYQSQIFCCEQKGFGAGDRSSGIRSFLDAASQWERLWLMIERFPWMAGLSIVLAKVSLPLLLMGFLTQPYP